MTEVHNPFTYTIHANGVVEVFDFLMYNRRHAIVATCGQCNRSWDDSIATAVTPTPAGRCPFEYEHQEA